MNAVITTTLVVLLLGYLFVLALYGVLELVRRLHG